jgi:hypothetical protein
LRILLDENLPRRLGQLLIGHEARTVAHMGWAGVKNGQLLTLAQSQFDIFLTMDQGIPYQQNLDKYEIAVFVLRAPSNSLTHLRPLVPAILVAAQSPRKRMMTVILP